MNRSKRTALPFRRISLLLALLLLAGCAASQEEGEPPQNDVVLKLMLPGSASGLDRVLAELYGQMDPEHRWRIEITWADADNYVHQLDSSLTAHEDYDLVFDAQWLSLSTQVSQRKYKNLKAYFNNPDYPGLQTAFPQEYLDANRFNGELYAIPLTNAYYDIPGFFYRKDLLDRLDLPFDEIRSYDEMTRYWDAVEQSGICKPVTLGSRGFYEFNMCDITLRKAGIWDITGWSFWSYPAKAVLSEDRTAILDVVFPGDDPDRFSGFPEPYRTNFLDEMFLKNAACAKWLSEEDLLQSDGTPQFVQGLSASYENSLGNGGSHKVEQLLKEHVPEGEVAFWAYDPAFGPNFRSDGILTNFLAWNYLCVPSYSDDPDEAMAFLDWLYSDWDRIDLFNYGVEGVDWQAIGDGEYALLNNPEGSFMFPAYELAWNPQHHRIDVALSESEKELMEYMFSPGSYAASPLAGYTIDTRPVGIEIASLNALYAEYYTGFVHGAYGDDTAEKIAEFHARSLEAGLEAVRGELVSQMQRYLDKKDGNS